MDDTDGAKFATLQRAAEVETERAFETHSGSRRCISVCLRVCLRVCVVYEETVPCVCVGELWRLVFGSGEC